MKLSHIFFLTIFFFSTALSGIEAARKVSQIRIFVPDKETLGRIWSSGIDYEGAEGKVGGWMNFVASEYGLQHLSTRGIPYEIIIDDLASYTENLLPKHPVNALGFGYGSIGGFYTYAEVEEQLDTMRLQYPNLITARDSIGTSHEARALWAVKISDNPELNEPDEPEVLYTALTHAREPEGMMAVLYYMWWLLENYGTDPEATYLVNNRQMWFIPVVNPDGYHYNEQTNPNGGGFWRKNRRNNGGGSYGVDPNRNYGPEYMWNAPNGGSSTDPNDDTYRGPAPFSEPENQAIDQFMRAHVVKSALNYHTYSNLLIYPWGYLSQENGDSLIYRDWAYDCTATNHYDMGTDLQTVQYATRGNSDDYMFGDTTKPSTFTMTPEVGTTGFWPTQSEILPLAMENLSSNKWISFFAGHYPTIRHTQIEDNGGNGFIDRGESFDLVLSLKNRGLNSAENLTVAASSNTPSISFTTSTVLLDSFPAQTETEVRFEASAAGSSPTGVPVQFYINFSDPDGFAKTDTLNMYIGTPAVVFADSASNGTGNWTTGQGWGVTTNAHSAPNAFTDSPTGNYHSDANNPLTLINQVSLTGYDYAQLKFWTKWSTEPTWDFATVEVSTNNGGSWTTVRTTTSTRGSGRSGGQQPSTSWGYDSYTPGLTWLEQEADLTTYVNRQIKIRFRVASDSFSERDGFYVDDIRLHAYTTNNDSGTAQVSLNASGFSDTLSLGDSSAFTLSVSNIGSALLDWAFENPNNTQWASVEPVSGNTSPGSTSDVTIFFRTEGLTADSTYTSSFLLITNDPQNDTIFFPVTLKVDNPTTVGQHTEEVPHSFALHQNYPNPFNPETIVAFDLPRSSFVTLRVYNIIGQEVATLVNRQLPAGVHSVTLNSSKLDLPSGVYLYRINASEFVQTRKMVILR